MKKVTQKEVMDNAKIIGGVGAGYLGTQFALRKFEKNEFSKWQKDKTKKPMSRLVKGGACILGGLGLTLYGGNPHLGKYRFGRVGGRR